VGAPPVLRTLFYADLFSWIGIMAHGMFYTGLTLYPQLYLIMALAVVV
jgi:hypothetical protein